MPGVAASDRKLLIVTGVVLFVLVLLVALVSPQQRNSGPSIPSTYTADSGGALAAYTLLQDLHRNVSRWESPPTELPDDPRGSVLIIADPTPTEPPSSGDRDALMQYLRNGGRVLFTGSDAATFFYDAISVESENAFEPEVFTANLPSGFTRGAPKISMVPESLWVEFRDPQFALYGDNSRPAVVSWRVGKGTFLWWAGATPLTNSGLLRENNLELFLDAVSDPSARAAAQPQIYWDEYFHGERTSLTSYIAKTPLPWGILQLCIIAIAVLVTFSRRSGPIAIPATVSRLAPLEFVDTLAGLYQRAHAEPGVVGIVYQRLRSGLIRQLRLSTTGSDLELGQAVSQRLGVNGTEFVRTMQRAAAASRDSSIPPAQAFTIVKQLEDYEEQFGLVRRKSQEKT